MYNWCVVLPLLFLPILSDIILVKPSLLVIVPSCPVMVRGVWSVVKAGKASVDVSNLRCRRCRHLSSPCLPKAPLPFEWALTGEPSKTAGIPDALAGVGWGQIPPESSPEYIQNVDTRNIGPNKIAKYYPTGFSVTNPCGGSIKGGSSWKQASHGSGSFS